MIKPIIAKKQSDIVNLWHDKKAGTFQLGSYKNIILSQYLKLRYYNCAIIKILTLTHFYMYVIFYMYMYIFSPQWKKIVRVLVTKRPATRLSSN